MTQNLAANGYNSTHKENSSTICIKNCTIVYQPS